MKLDLSQIMALVQPEVPEPPKPCHGCGTPLPRHPYHLRVRATSFRAPVGDELMPQKCGRLVAGHTEAFCSEECAQLWYADGAVHDLGPIMQPVVAPHEIGRVPCEVCTHVPTGCGEDGRIHVRRTMADGQEIEPTQIAAEECECGRCAPDCTVLDRPFLVCSCTKTDEMKAWQVQRAAAIDAEQDPTAKAQLIHDLYEREGREMANLLVEVLVQDPTSMGGAFKLVAHEQHDCPHALAADWRTPVPPEQDGWFRSGEKRIAAEKAQRDEVERFLAEAEARREAVREQNRALLKAENDARAVALTPETVPQPQNAAPAVEVTS